MLNIGRQPAGAQSGTWTHTPQMAEVFETSVSTIPPFEQIEKLRFSFFINILVGKGGVEPPIPQATVSKTVMYTNSNTYPYMEAQTRIFTENHSLTLSFC